MIKFMVIDIGKYDQEKRKTNWRRDFQNINISAAITITYYNLRVSFLFMVIDIWNWTARQ